MRWLAIDVLALSLFDLSSMIYLCAINNSELTGFASSGRGGGSSIDVSHLDRDVDRSAAARHIIHIHLTRYLCFHSVIDLSVLCYLTLYAVIIPIKIFTRSQPFEVKTNPTIFISTFPLDFHYVNAPGKNTKVAVISFMKSSISD